MAVGDAHVFPGFLIPVLTRFLSRTTNYFSHMLQQKLEAKIRLKENKWMDVGQMDGQTGAEQYTCTLSSSYSKRFSQIFFLGKYKSPVI